MASNEGTVTVDLGRAIHHYTSSLVDRLRGFSSGADVAPFLDRWVHDEDLARSLVSMAEAADEHGLETVHVTLDATLAPRLEAAALKSAFGEAAIAASSTDGLAVTIDVRKAVGQARHVGAATQGQRRFSESTASLAEPLPFLLPAHRESLRAHPAPRSLADVARCDWSSSVERRGVTWTLGVTDGLVAASRVDGADDDLAVLVSFAATQLLGLPAREAREHGASRTELALRGLGGAIPVKGILLPKRAGTGLAELQSMLDEWTLTHDKKFGATKGLNEFERAPQATWAGMGADERISRVRDIVAKTSTRMGLDADAVQLLAIEKEILVHLSQPDVAGSGAKGRVLMAVERALRIELDPALVVTTEERRDGNKLRRLTVAKEA